MSNIKVFNYKDNTISFEFTDGNKMINATQLAKPFGKLVGNFLKAQHAKDYILILESRYSKQNNGKRKVLRVVQGGSPDLQGTWMDEKLALKFAAWLSSGFELWVYDRIEELIKTGKTELDNRPSTDLIRAIRMIADKLEYQQKDIDQNKESIADLQDSVNELNAKITAIDENYYSVSGWCALNLINCPNTKAKEWGKLCTRLSTDLGYEIGEAYHPVWGTVGSYHKEVLKQVIK